MPPTHQAIPTIIPQNITSPLTKHATFLVLTVNRSPDGLPPTGTAIKTIQKTLSTIASLSKTISIRDQDAAFACTVGIGAALWPALVGPTIPPPRELHPFKPVRGSVHSAPSTPGDLFFHIRSQRRDLNFEFERLLLLDGPFGEAVSVVDATEGWRYFDVRDLLGFVDGTANPVPGGVGMGDLVIAAGDEEGGAEGGSYVVVQKYLHDMKAWQGLKAEEQERIIGRTKWDNVELADAASGEQASHKTLATVEDGVGGEHAILRDNMPFGAPGKGEFGTYFVGYSARLWVIETMLQRMFVGDPPGKYDRLLDYSTPLTGTTFFVPSASLLAGLGE
ncbi:hypothetical protein B0T22DRAFT_476135 [Podospora appendiculata]|uniref:Dyp-type peroxidase n=1 Tax=Podospora appendiculata TaxID=314037 RepID=A0AAE1CGF2_9PEZI|nr:hypothetical protein B0T22DRAFT_476135 [Podospora appendiculata]